MMVIPKWNTSAAKALPKTKHLPARLEVVPLPDASDFARTLALMPCRALRPSL